MAATLAPTRPALLTTAQAAERCGLAPGTLANLRCSRLDGPPWVKLRRKVFYREADLDRWIEAQLVTPADTPSSHAPALPHGTR